MLRWRRCCAALTCSEQLLLLRELDLTPHHAQLNPGVGGALAVLVAASTALRSLSLGGAAIGMQGAAPLARALRRNTSLTSVALDGPRRDL